MSFKTIIYEEEGAIGWVTLNRPDAMNAFNAQLTREFIDACASFNADPDVRVVIVTGAGEKAFSAGLDLKERAAEQGFKTYVDHDLSQDVKHIGTWEYEHHHAVSMKRPLREALYRGEWWAPRLSGAIRGAAAAALARVGTPAAADLPPRRRSARAPSSRRSVLRD